MNFDDLLYGAIYFESLNLAIKSGIFERIEEGANTYESLCKSLALDQDQKSLEAILMLLQEIGLLVFKNGRLENTKLSKKKLLNASKESELEFIEYLNDEITSKIRECGKKILLEKEKTSAPERLWEKSLEDINVLFYKDGNQANNLSGFLRKKAFEAGETFASLIPFNKFSSLVDLGGNDGSFIIPILNKHKNLKGIVFDLPILQSHIQHNIEQNKLQSRLSFVSGSLFHDTIPSADCYLIRLVLHDFSDEACLRILKRVTEVMPEDSKILIVENVIDNPINREKRHILATNVYLTLHGEHSGNHSRERSIGEYVQLAEASGLKVQQKYFQKNIILVCGKKEEGGALITSQKTNSIFDLCEAPNFLESKRIMIKVDTSEKCQSLIIKSRFHETEVPFRQKDDIYPISTLGFLIKKISIIDKGEYHQSDNGIEFIGRKLEITDLKQVFPKLRYARRTIWIKRINRIWGLYDSEDRLIDII